MARRANAQRTTKAPTPVNAMYKTRKKDWVRFVPSLVSSQHCSRNAKEPSVSPFWHALPQQHTVFTPCTADSCALVLPDLGPGPGTQPPKQGGAYGCVAALPDPPAGAIPVQTGQHLRVVLPETREYARCVASSLRTRVDVVSCLLRREIIRACLTTAAYLLLISQPK